MGDRGLACLMCPNLSITALGLVRHIQTAHATDSVEVINKAFGGVRTFGQCPHCPEKFLIAGIKAHINSKHNTQGRGTLGHSAVKKLTTTQPPTLQARWESQQPGGKANQGPSTRGPVIRRVQALTHTPAQPGSAPPQPEAGLLAKEVTNSSSQRFKQWSDGSRYTGCETQESDSDCDATTQFVSYVSGVLTWNWSYLGHCTWADHFLGPF